MSGSNSGQKIIDNLEKIIRNIQESETDQIIGFLLDIEPKPAVFAFTGEVGAGKTTLIKKLVKELGSDDVVSSPTFSIVNEYHTNDRKKIYHSDWYRIKNILELYDAGIEEYLFEENAIFIVEWPEIGMELLDGSDAVYVEITHQSDGRDYRIFSK